MVDDLFRDANAPRAERAKPPGDAANPIQRTNDRKTIRLAEGVRWERLTPRPDPEVEFLYVVYEVGAESCDKDSLIRHGGKEYAYVIRGRLGLKIGLEKFEMGPGEFDHVRRADAAPVMDDREEAGRGHLGRLQPPRRQPGADQS